MGKLPGITKKKRPQTSYTMKKGPREVRDLPLLQDCPETSQSYTWTARNTLQYNDLEPHILDYLSKRGDLLRKISKKMEQYSTIVHWPGTATENNVIELKISPRHSTTGLKNHWMTSILQTFRAVIDEHVSLQIVVVPTEIRADMKSEMKDADLSVNSIGQRKWNGNDLVIVGDPEYVKVWFVWVQRQYGKLDSAESIVQIEEHRETHLKLVTSPQFSDDFKAKFNAEKIINAKTSIILTGKKKHQQQIREGMEQTLSCIRETRIEEGVFDNLIVKAILMDTNIDRIQNIITSSNGATICYKENSGLHIVGQTQEILDAGVQAIKRNLGKCELPLPENITDLMQWVKQINKLKEDFSDSSQFEIDECSFKAAGFTDKLKVIEAKVKQMIGLLTINEHEFPIKQSDAECLLPHFHEKKNEIMAQEDGLCLEVILKEDTPCIWFRCADSSKQNIIDYFSDILKAITTTEQTYTQVGLNSYLKRTHDTMLTDVGNTFKTVITKIVHDEAIAEVDAPAVTSNYILHFKYGTKLKMMVGNITQEKADVIVNTTGTDLRFDGELAQAVLHAGGAGMKRELSQYSSPMPFGSIIQTDGHGMQCSKVYHMIFQNYDNNDECQKIMKQQLKDCLHRAALDGKTSIILPAIGSGGFKWPPAIVASELLDVIQNFDREKTKLKDIKMIMLPSKTENIESYADKIMEKQQQLLADFEETKSVMLHPEIKEQQECYVPPITLKIQGLCPRDVQAASNDLQKRIDDLLKIIPVGDDLGVIMYLREEDEIRKCLHGKEIKMVISQMKHQQYIELEGLPEEVEEAGRAIEKILHKLVAFRKTGETAHASWEYDGTLIGRSPFQRFSEVSMGIIESAHKEKRFDETFDISEGNVFFRIHLRNMSAYVEIDEDEETGFQCEIYRRPHDFPSNWFPSEDESKLMYILEDGQEFQSVAQQFLGTLNKRASILEICRIQNAKLLREFLAHKDTISKKYSGSVAVEERRLWHGTAKEHIESITKNHFDRGFTTVHAFGRGVYFAVNSRYSANPRYSVTDSSGVQHMFLARVLVGSYTQGSKDMTVTPPIDPGNPSIRYDSLCDNPANPTIYVTFNDAQAYPEYLIKFKQY